MSLRILHVDQDLTTASFQSFHSEHSWLQHLVAMRLNTCNLNTKTQGEVMYSATQTMFKGFLRLRCLYYSKGICVVLLFSTEKVNNIHYTFILSLVYSAGVHGCSWATHQVRRLWPCLGKAVLAWEERRASALLWGTGTGMSSLSARPHLGPQSPQEQSPTAQTEVLIEK